MTREEAMRELAALWREAGHVREAEKLLERAAREKQEKPDER